MDLLFGHVGINFPHVRMDWLGKWSWLTLTPNSARAVALN